MTMLARASYDEFDLQSRLPSANGNTVGPVSSVAKYLQMRRLRLERTHQEDLDQFMHDFGRSFGNANAAMTEYFRRYKERAVESQAAYRKAKAAIMADRNMDYLRKQQAIQRLNPGTEPAWTQELEDAFVRQYGEPREQRMLWNAEMAAMMTETVEEISNFVSISRNRTNWERMVPYLLAHPELDDSVAPCTVIELHGNVGPVQSAILTRDVWVPPVVPIDADPEYHEAMTRAARAVCPHCKDIFPRGFASHERACAKRHNVPSITEVKLPDDAPTLLARPTLEDDGEPEGLGLLEEAGITE